MSVTKVATAANTTRVRRLWRLLLACLCAAGLVSGCWAWWTDRRYKSAMEEIESEVVVGRYAIACRNLDKLSSWKADPNGEIVYLLGSCELARGRNQAAGEAWARVPPGSTFSEKAIEGRMHLLQASGKLADAERLVRDAAQDPRNDRTALLVLLAPLYSKLGRITEGERLIEDRWEHLNAMGDGALEPAIKLVLQHIEFTLKPTPVEAIRGFLDRASKLAPDDDRVWLGRANLAIRTGDYDEAERWLDACQAHRPDDVPVWHARLNLGMATNRIDVVTQALTHIPAAHTDPAPSHRLSVWLAFHRGDIDTERRELELLVAADPTDFAALGRLAGLAGNEGKPARAADLSRVKAEIDRLLARYRDLHGRQQPFRDAPELARLAEQLGRRFEARAFLTIALSEDPARTDLRRNLERLSKKPAAAADPRQPP
jgi:thioredoxin-like negative regulator of GroEL